MPCILPPSILPTPLTPSDLLCFDEFHVQAAEVARLRSEVAALADQLAGRPVQPLYTPSSTPSRGPGPSNYGPGQSSFGPGPSHHGGAVPLGAIGSVAQPSIPRSRTDELAYKAYDMVSASRLEARCADEVAMATAGVCRVQGQLYPQVAGCSILLHLVEGACQLQLVQQILCGDSGTFSGNSGTVSTAVVQPPVLSLSYRGMIVYFVRINHCCCCCCTG